MENEKHSGGCGCGAVRYETTGDPVRAGICHCRYCQTRTGSAFGISVYFEENQINLINGELTEYNFTNSSGRSFKNKFCKTCGTTVLWEVELRKGLIGVGGGTFDMKLALKFSADLRHHLLKLAYQKNTKLPNTTNPLNPIILL